MEPCQVRALGRVQWYSLRQACSAASWCASRARHAPFSSPFSLSGTKEETQTSTGQGIDKVDRTSTEIGLRRAVQIVRVVQPLVVLFVLALLSL